ncbi:hypothetical protein ABFS82_04G178200 [Erythranthe guttata]|uniref:Protein kinase domain-containing protein n=1 Tax=Erythranthe guttata TaxID=4155 RepID=A0A022PQN6_ERYGU|nr:PREDICTED: uncharacterized protein LOC105950451 [Erythranthe guttata]XP_012829265.1 PREDICTED: uncharacterized protein LOC105950451 [Erythranthe guttata]EYU17784.1 hypothetical protein MIMGU_mgv1a000734mg [Erythranthe guttata]|eukprot:XP_012829264.1 PREDICTED: uncharacterized protein LOC105950451 [Erythranthe guttata]
MAESSPVDDILEFLKRNKFAKAEAALRNELSHRSDLNGLIQKLTLDDKESNSRSNEAVNGAVSFEKDRKIVTSQHSEKVLKGSSIPEASKELIVKEVECGKGSGAIGKKSMVNASVGTSDNNFEFSKNSDDTVLDLYSRKLIELEEVDRQRKPTNSSDNPLSGNNVLSAHSSLPKTVFPLSGEGTSSSYDSTTSAIVDKKEGKMKIELHNIRTAIKDEVDFGALEFRLASENQKKEELPRLPPVRLKPEEKPFNIQWEEKYERGGGPGPKILNADNGYLIGSFLDVPIGREFDPSGKMPKGGSWLSVSQGIAEDTSDLFSGFATIGDGLSESVDYPNDYWDSDEYEDDEDVGYMRQPIEDETWFLAHEVDYPSDNEKVTGHGSFPDTQEREQDKDDEDEDEEDDQSFAEEDSYISGEQYFQSKSVDPAVSSENPVGQYEEELSLMCTEPVWQGLIGQNNELRMLENGKITSQFGRPHLDDDQHGSVRSIGVGINSDVADFGSEVRDSLVGGSSEGGDIDYFDAHKNRTKRQNLDKVMKKSKNQIDGGFSFPPPRDDCIMANDDMVTSWRRKSSGESSPVKSSMDEKYANTGESANSSPSSLSNYGYIERVHVKKEDDVIASGVREEEDPGALLEDEEAAAVQEQVKQIKAQEDEFETFNLKIVHRKNRTGFEEDKSFHVVLNSVLAGRYHVTEYLGSAAFSKAIQAHDLHTGMDVCVKIIKNNKDFFDQSLDEIKLLKYVNKHDPGDKYHLLRLYDYFYYREHLLIVCELLKANLYEFHKFNRESGGEVYFTMPRLQSITIQCLEALQFLHGLGLIHCDLKPENILVKSYSRCEVKVIDLGSSCFGTDNLCSYVQSRSYRAPEVILGLPYDKKIDIWSLGCILAELCTGNVLFQNDSPATLLARVIGIVGLIEQDMLAKGRDTYKYFTKNHMLYERNQDTNILEYLIPKKSSLRHRLPMGDQGFVDFVSHLLEVNPNKRPSASEALKHPWLQYPYEPISS